MKTRFHLVQFMIGALVALSASGAEEDGALTNLTRKIGSSELPRPIPVDRVADLWTGRFDAVLVEVTGFVRAVADRDGRLVLHLRAGEFHIPVVIENFPEPLNTDLIDARVVVWGVCRSVADAKGTPVSVSLFAADFEQVKILSAGSASPFGLRPLPIAALSEASHRDQRARILGEVTQPLAGGRLVVSDGSGAIIVEIEGEDTTRIAVGAYLDVAGAVRVEDGENILVDTVYRRLGEASSRAGDDLPILRTVSEVRELLPAEAEKRYPVKLTGVITYYEPYQDCFIQDETQGIFVNIGSFPSDLEAGDYVEIEAETDPGEFAPQLENARFRLLGKSDFPAPKRMTWSRLMTGQGDSQWVATEGVIQSVAEDDSRAVGTIGLWGGASAMFNFPSSVPVDDVRALLGASIEFQGVCATDFNDRRQLVGLKFLIPSLDGIVVNSLPPEDPFLLPMQSMESVMQFRAGESLPELIRVQGTVTHYSPGSFLFIQDETESIYVSTRQNTTLAIGDVVDVAGFPKVGMFSPSLQEAVFRRTGDRADVIPEPLKLEREFIPSYQSVLDELGDLDAQLVEVQGKLIDRTEMPSYELLIVQAGTLPLTVQLEKGRQTLQEVELQSVVSIRGIFTVSVLEGMEPTLFRVLMRGPEDLTVLETPPLLSWRHWVLLMGLTAGAGVAALGWVALLRRQVRRQTETIRRRVEDQLAAEARYRELFDQANDLVFAHDREGRLTSYNPACAKVLGYSQAEALGRPIRDVLGAEQAEISRGIVEQPGCDGRRYELMVRAKEAAEVVLEINAHPIYSGGECVGIEAIARDITERQESMRAMRDSEKRFRQVFDHAADGMVVHDADGKMILVNQSICECLGYSEAELLQMKIREIETGLSQLDLNRIWSEVQSGGVVNVEGRHRRKDGTSLPVEIRLRALDLNEGRIFLAVIRDVSERRAGEARRRVLSELGQHLSAATDPGDAAKIILSAANEVIGWDAGFLCLGNESGNPTVFWAGLRGVEEGDPGAAMDERVLRIVKRGMAGEAFIDELVSNDNKDLWGGATLAAPLRVGNTVVGVLAVESFRHHPYSDVDRVVLRTLADFAGGALQRIQAAEELRRSERRFGQVFETSPLSITLATLEDGRLLAVNPAFTELFGYSREDVKDQTTMGLGIWMNADERANLVQMLQDRRPVRGLEFEFRARSGRSVRGLVWAELIEWAGQECILFMTHDVTDRLRLEEQLRHSQKLEAVGQLAAGVAHDFNNIMTIIQGHASLALSEASDPSSATSFHAIMHACERAANLTKDLLVFSRKQSIRLAPLDVNALVRRMVQLLGRVLGEHIAVEFHESSQLGLVQGDAGMLEQVIMNLAVNARDAMPKGGRILLATTVEPRESTPPGAHSERDGACVCLEVTDTGEGIPPDLMSRIFEPFFTTKEIGKGSGLGLATVYGIVQQHGGKVDVESQLGHGTTFRIRIPAAAVAAVAAVAGGVLPSAPAAELEAATGGSERILVVEDEPALANLVATVLGKNGYSVKLAGSGREALDVWKDSNGEFDLLLTDIMMPDGMNGWELAERLLQEEPSLKVIFTSGYNVEMTAQEKNHLAQGPFLQKPYSHRVLLSMVRSELSRQKGEGD